MPTIGLKTELTLANQKTKTNLGGFYKSFEKNANFMGMVPLRTNEPVTFDVSDTNFIIMFSDGKPLDEESINIELYDDNGSFEIRHSAFFMMSFKNLTKVIVTNTSLEEAVINIIY